MQTTSIDQGKRVASCINRKICGGSWLAALIVGTISLSTPTIADGQGYSDLPPQELCGLCHRMNGISATAKFPKLAGQKASYIEKQLRDFLEGRRSNDGGQMVSIVTEIEPAQILEVAKYFSQLAPPPPSSGAMVDLTAADLKGAAGIFENGKPSEGLPACKSCHESHNPGHPVAPYLTAQHAGYLERQLNDFRSGRRSNDLTSTMPGIANKLSRREIQALALYLASRTRKGP